MALERTETFTFRTGLEPALEPASSSVISVMVSHRSPLEPESEEAMFDATGCDAPWPASILLAEYVAHFQGLECASVIELGCGGTALPGLVAAKLGAVVTLSDGEERAVLRAGRNANLNDLSARPLVLAFGDEPTGDAARFDWVLASDVLYASKTALPLARSVAALVEPVSGVFLLAHTERRTSYWDAGTERLVTEEDDGPLAAFLAGASRLGLVFKTVISEPQAAPDKQLVLAFARSPDRLARLPPSR